MCNIKARKLMKNILIILLFMPSLVGAEIYKWVDEKGSVHFGDSPREEDKAEKIVVNVTSYKFVKVENIEFYQKEKSQKGSGKVVMYSTSWCGYCKKARRYFKEKSVAYVEYDIEKDNAAHKRFKALGGTGVPVIVVGKKKMSGFNVQRFESIYQ